ncbi:MAG TPA: glycoside hydrolase family 3 C-terminal domain-containing protein [Steroidobacteraceae bacterium]|nr:glycoside hydrolase family 3 C-terminal domain-containing protein [Steroidobacteraceae bacterium]
MKTELSRFAAGLIGLSLAGGTLPGAAAAAATPRLGGSTATVAADQRGAAYKAAVPALWNPALPVRTRVRALISKMTLEEKAGQLGNAAPAIPRLGVPEYNWWNEGLHGVARAGIATVFPQAIGMAATWDTPLMHRTADIISTEFRAKYAATVHPDGGSAWYQGLTIWSPNINIFRDPRWGRGQETYGEDPYLTSRLGVAFITGLQGDDSGHLKTIATSKHFAVHSGPESTRHEADIHVSRHDLEDTYLPAFRATVTEGKVQSVMCAYNAVDGQPACANPLLLEQHLRKDWGFKGYVVSDCGAAADIYLPPGEGHHYAPDPEKAMAEAFEAGMDLICGDYRNNMNTEQAPIIKAVRDGLLPEAVVDRALERLFTARIELGMFDPPRKSPYAKIPAADNDTPAHREAALRMAEESLVLLKNSGNLLPLAHAPAHIAVIGPNADSLDALLGNYNGTPSHPVTILAGIRRRFPRSQVTYVEGTGLLGPVTPASRANSAAAALAAARQADLVVLVAGLSPRIEGEEMKIHAQGFSGGDRTSLDLPGPQSSLLKRVQALGKPVVLVLMNGGALGINWADRHIPAIVEAWYPGEEGGSAVAALLAGDFSPAGRLPVTFYRSVDQLPAFDDYSMSNRTYRYFKGEVLYPFGYGLSYTSFKYAHARVSKRSISPSDAVTVSVDVTNSGGRAGDEVVELYLTHEGVAGAPQRALKGFQRIRLAPGEVRHVEFTLRARDLAVVDESGKHRIVPGVVAVWVGGGQPVSRPGTQPAAGLETRFSVNGSRLLPD